MPHDRGRRHSTVSNLHFLFDCMAARDWYDIATLASSIASSVGTIGAVVVALWLSRRDTKPRLTVRAAVHTAPEYGQRYIDGRRFVLVKVSNIGLRDVQIGNLLWHIGYRRLGLLRFGKAWIQTMDSEKGSMELQHVLPPGQSGLLLYDLEAFLSKNAEMLKHFPTRRWFRPPVFVGLSATTGEEWWARLSYDEVQRIAGRAGRRPTSLSDL